MQYGISTVRRQAFDPLHPRCPSSSFRDVNDKRLFSRTDRGGSGSGGVLGREALNTWRSGMLSTLSDICERNRFFAAKGPKQARENGRCQGTEQIVQSSLQTANGSASDSLTQNNLMRFGAGELKAKSSALSPSQYFCHLQTSTALSTAIRIVFWCRCGWTRPEAE